MDEQILIDLQLKLYEKYKYLKNNHFVFIEVYGGIIVLNWSPLNDEYINYYRVEQIKNFMFKYLKEKNEEGFFYVGVNAIKI